MTTLEQIKLAHSKVKTGADFPAYIKELKVMGVLFYETFVSDGRTGYHLAADRELVSPPKYDRLLVSAASDSAQFREDLLNHQQGKSDYSTFCKQAAASGVEKWQVSTIKMTCTYFDLAGNKLLEEKIPG